MDLSEKISNSINACFSSCKSCFAQGDEINNNCIECKDGFTFLNETINEINCYPKCQYYYYFNSLNQYLCTENEVCPEPYTKLIPQYKKCIDECKKDSIYKYDYDNICYVQCPNLTKISEDHDYICIRNEYNEDNFYECSNDDQLSRICSIKNTDNNTEIYDIITNQILEDYSPDDEKSQIIEGADGTIFQITTGKNELDLLMNGDSSDNYSLSIIDLGECESKLKDEYNLNDNDTLIYIKKEKKSNKSSEKDIEFEVFEPYNKTKLNLSLCYDTKINVYVKLELSPETEELNEQMKELGYNIFNINDPFYQDICTPYKSSGKTDMLLSDRIDDIYNNEDARCQPNCYFAGYFFGSQYINCTCNVNKEKKEVYIKEEKFKPKKLYESFFEVLKYSNYKIMKCYKLIGNKRMITKNIGNILLLILFIIYLICLICYIIKKINPLKNKLNEILIIEEEQMKIYNGDIKIHSKKIDDKIKTKNKIEKNNKDNKNDKKDKKRKSKNKLKSPPKKKQNKNSRKSAVFQKEKKKKNSDISKSQKILIKRNTNYNINQSKKRPINIIFNPRNSSNNDKFVTQNNKSEKENKPNNYDDFELNELEYEEATKLDKRSFSLIYYSLLKREHKILFTFFIHNNYNLFYIKLSRFIFLIVSDMAMNALFFSDESMHTLYISYGKYDFIQQIPKIVYSTIISQITEVFLCF